MRGSRWALTALVISACGPFGEGGVAEPGFQGDQAALVTPLAYRGVNLAGADFGIDEWGNGLVGGVHGVSYVYPDPAFVPGYTSADYFIGKGMNTFRLPFRWERLQPVLGGAFDAAELARLQTTVTNLTDKGAYVLIDPHNYARYWGGVIGAGVLREDFANFWWRLADFFKGNSRVIFGLMNEPNNMPTENWVDAANSALGAIRNAGATNLVLVPGNAWSGAWTWEESWYGWRNADAMLWISDPGSNVAFEVHQYFNADGSGSSSNCVSPTIGAERLSAFTSWLRVNGKRGFLGEFGVAAEPTCASALDGMLAHLELNADVYLGWTYWAAGPSWGDYYTSLEPVAGIDKPQMNVLEAHLPAGTPPPQPLVCPKSYEAEVMYHSTGGSDTGGWNLWANGYVAAQHNFQQGTNTLMVSARGTPAGGVWPHMVVTVNGVAVAQAAVTSSSYAQHWFRFTVPGGSAELRVVFDNDAIVGAEDRNLIVDSVTIHCGSTYEAESMYHQVGGPRPGAWNIWSNGYISTWHDFPAATQAISVIAAGEAANGWPHMVVTVGGVTIGGATVGSASYQPYTFYTWAPLTGEIRVVFDNDAYIPGVGDRNLLIDRVTVFRP